MGLSYYINQERLRYSKYFLATTTRKVADVAFATGFGNLGWYNELFKSQVGMTPREYRIRAQKSGL